jgi:hypothetical protein
MESWLHSRYGVRRDGITAASSVVHGPAKKRIYGALLAKLAGRERGLRCVLVRFGLLHCSFPVGMQSSCLLYFVAYSGGLTEYVLRSTYCVIYHGGTAGLLGC